ncbi:MAG: cytochrome c biosis protein CcmG, thiol:disulfide interchange protein DsbE [Solirubrobacteraceae bacterium]|jgi:cytochrome c biogenesis protein CcmG/thiol:disulfide interchange protein DsbE|nr:cytochrome c biosis protein CcmG, thiol:disulfide interchange protein DsbE [Solirubrobacteraceae bacterium]MEA2187521.1 cytochrome c biosis protein CcmG, thiol:disulfide interchange protein DsbE [Solirubrobacteraceae bacterium]
MKRLLVPALAAVVAAGLIGLLAYGLVSKSDDTSIEQAVARGERPAAPSLKLPVLGGRGTHSVADLRGKVVVLNFWASWCIPCKSEAPMLEKAQQRLQQTGAGTVVGVTYDDSTPDALQFVRDFKVRYPNVRDVGTKLASRYGTHRVPETFVIDQQGRIVDLHRGQIDQAFIDRALAKAIG